MEEGDGETYGYVRLSQGTDQLTLLSGYDSMRLLLEHCWEHEGRRSDDLAGLLGSMNRNVGENGPPLDAAQWSDWLDAILVIRPDLKCVKDARAKIQADHLAFTEVLKIKESETQRTALDLLREEARKRSWHIAGNERITSFEGYAAVVVFLRAYWNAESKHILQIIRQLEDDQSGLWEAWLAATAKYNEIERKN